jgi:hypothetical protein
MLFHRGRVRVVSEHEKGFQTLDAHQPRHILRARGVATTQTMLAQYPWATPSHRIFAAPVPLGTCVPPSTADESRVAVIWLAPLHVSVLPL